MGIISVLSWFPRFFYIFLFFFSTEITKRLKISTVCSRNRLLDRSIWHVVLLSLYNNYYDYRLAPTKFRPQSRASRSRLLLRTLKVKRAAAPHQKILVISILQRRFTPNSQFEKATDEKLSQLSAEWTVVRINSLSLPSYPLERSMTR